VPTSLIEHSFLSLLQHTGKLKSRLSVQAEDIGDSLVASSLQRGDRKLQVSMAHNGAGFVRSVTALALRNSV
jgi:hypothetical protein